MEPTILKFLFRNYKIEKILPCLRRRAEKYFIRKFPKVKKCPKLFSIAEEHALRMRRRENALRSALVKLAPPWLLRGVWGGEDPYVEGVNQAVDMLHVPALNKQVGGFLWRLTH